MSCRQVTGAITPVGAHAGQYDAEHVAAEDRCGRLEQNVDGWATVVHGWRLLERDGGIRRCSPECEVMIAWRDEHRAVLEWLTEALCVEALCEVGRVHRRHVLRDHHRHPK